MTTIPNEIGQAGNGPEVHRVKFKPFPGFFPQNETDFFFVSCSTLPANERSVTEMKTTSQSMPDDGIDQSENVIFTLLPVGASILKQKVRFLSLIERAAKFDPVLTFLDTF